MNEKLTLKELRSRAAGTDPATLAREEPFWARVAGLYDRDPSFVQLNYGYYHPALSGVLDAEVRALHEGNRRGSQFKLTDAGPLLEAARLDAAALIGMSSEEVALTRSSSESINQVIKGLPLQSGDEVVASNMDYVAVQQVLDQRAADDGIVVRRVEIPSDPQTDDLVERFAALLSPRTKLLVVTHVIHSTGRVLPAGELCALARRRGVPVFVDAAHSVGLFEIDAGSLGCDYLCTSLHKWIGAPLGNGLLAVRRDRIPSLRPLYGDVSHAPDDIRRFERLGNRSDAAIAGLREALRWHSAFTTPLKGSRLRYLHDRWGGALRTEPGFRLHSPRSDAPRSAIGMVTLDGLDSAEVGRRLMKEFGLFTSVQATPWGNGVRIVPGLPTSAEEIDRLVEALLAIRGRP